MHGWQAGRQTGSGTPWQEITYLHGALWSGGRGRARQGGVADVAAKVTQSNRGSAKSERERRSLRLVLGPFRTLTHCRRVGRQWQWQRQGQWRWQGQALGEGWRVSLVVLKLRVAGSLASLWGLTDSAWFVAC